MNKVCVGFGSQQLAKGKWRAVGYCWDRGVGLPMESALHNLRGQASHENLQPANLEEWFTAENDAV